MIKAHACSALTWHTKANFQHYQSDFTGVFGQSEILSCLFRSLSLSLPLAIFLPLSPSLPWCYHGYQSIGNNLISLQLGFICKTWTSVLSLSSTLGAKKCRVHVAAGEVLQLAAEGVLAFSVQVLICRTFPVRFWAAGRREGKVYYMVTCDFYIKHLLRAN